MKALMRTILLAISDGCNKNKLLKTSGMGYCYLNEILRNLGMDSEIDKYKAYEAIQELYLHNLIMKDPHHPDAKDTITLTSKGRDIIRKQLDIEEYSLRLENHIKRQELLEEAQDSFNDGKYETSVFSAYRLVEDTLRNKARSSADSYGRNLVAEALSPKKGKLRDSNCASESEEIGVYNLFLGGIGYFKNPSSHRKVGYEEPRRALQAIVLAELLLSVIDTCVPRE